MCLLQCLHCTDKGDIGRNRGISSPEVKTCMWKVPTNCVWRDVCFCLGKADIVPEYYSWSFERSHAKRLLPEKEKGKKQASSITTAACCVGAPQASYDKHRNRNCFQTRPMPAFPKIKPLLRSEVSWCDQTNIDLDLRRSTMSLHA